MLTVSQLTYHRQSLSNRAGFVSNVIHVSKTPDLSSSSTYVFTLNFHLFFSKDSEVTESLLFGLLSLVNLSKHVTSSIFHERETKYHEQKNEVYTVTASFSVTTEVIWGLVI